MIQTNGLGMLELLSSPLRAPTLSCCFKIRNKECTIYIKRYMRLKSICNSNMKTRIFENMILVISH